MQLRITTLRKYQIDPKAYLGRWLLLTFHLINFKILLVLRIYLICFYHEKLSWHIELRDKAVGDLGAWVDQMGYHKEVWILGSLLKKTLQFRAKLHQLHQVRAFLMLCNNYASRKRLSKAVH